MSPVDARRILAVDADNILLAGHESVTPCDGRRRAREIQKLTHSVNLTLAVISTRMLREMGSDLLYEFSDWTWRFAERGPDAADLQLIDFCTANTRSVPTESISIASGDHIFKSLESLAPLRVCVPNDHIGVARCLKPLVIPTGDANAPDRGAA